MPATILDGNKIASDIKAEVAAEARALAEAGLKPGLAAVLVGNDPASEIYVRSKVKTCEALGICSAVSVSVTFTSVGIPPDQRSGA